MIDPAPMRFALVLMLVACAPRRSMPPPEPPPAPEPEPAPASEPEPEAPVRLDIQAGVYREPSIGVIELRDVWIRGPEDLSIVRNDLSVGGSAWCNAQGCVLPLVTPAERVRLSAEEDVVVEVQPLPLPEPVRIRPGETVEVLPRPVAEGDPRGPIADIRFHLVQPSSVKLDFRPVHDSPDHSGVHLVSVELFGPQGSRTATVFGQFDKQPGRRENTWMLDAGDWTIRVSPEGEDVRRIYCDPREDLPQLVPPAWCAEPVDGGPFALRLEWVATGPLEEPPPDPPEPRPEPDHRLLEDPVSIAVRAEPEPVFHGVRVPRGQDIVVSWEPRDARLSTRWIGAEGGETTRFCHEWPCVHPAADFDRLELQVFNEPEPRTVSVQVDVRALPEPIGELQPGYVMSLSTGLVTEGDPRGPLADIVLAIDKPGEYLVGVAYDVEGGPLPQLDLSSPWGGQWSHSMWNVLGAEGYTAQRYVVEEAGRYLLRVDGVGPDVPARSLEVELQHADP